MKRIVLVSIFVLMLCGVAPAVDGPKCDLHEALDTTGSFTTGGNADWFCQTTTSYYDGDAVQSGGILHNQQSWIQTTVSGCGTVKFHWKVSSEGDFDYLEFYIDGELLDRIGGEVNWQQMTYTIIAAGLHTLQWRYVKDKTGSSGSDCGWVDRVQWVAAECSPACDFSNALDTTLSFTTGGDANWSCQTISSYYDGDAAQSGHISHNQQSWIATTVSGYGMVSFYWKVSSESKYDYLEFYIDGVLQDRISGLVDWQQMKYTVATSGLHILEWRYIKDHSDSAGSDCGLLDLVEWMTIGPPAPCDLSEALDTTLSFIVGGSADWFCQTTNSYHGGDAARSGGISHEQESWMQTKVSGAGTVSFYWKVVSEKHFDYLEFYIDGLLQEQISGSVDWHRITYTVTASGLHKLEWRYVKDGTVSFNSDCGWVDQVQWEPVGFPPPCDLSAALDTTLNFIAGGSAIWFCQHANSYYDGDAAQSGQILDNQHSRMRTMVSGRGMVSFYWKVSSEVDDDYLQFYIDGVRQDEISGSVDWHQMTYWIITPGWHTLEWRYIKGPSGSEGYDCGWVDQVQWVPEAITMDTQ